MGKLAMIIIVCLLVMAGAGFVSVSIEKGPKKLLEGLVGDMIYDSASMLESALPWAEEMSLEIYKPGEAHRQLKNLNSIIRPVRLIGTVTGEGGQELQVVIDADYTKKTDDTISGVVAIGSDVDLDVQRSAGGWFGPLVRDVSLYTQGDFNASIATNTWPANTAISSSAYTQTGDVLSLQSYVAYGEGSSQLTVLSNNYISQQLHTEIEIERYGPGKGNSSGKPGQGPKK